ncbi:MAG: hypothetical protein LBQ90_03700 [Synergistaceae bacterium]|jgi:hypothetical protein|nr:hypothetical protein [Synergistaceae bacterium]
MMELIQERLESLKVLPYYPYSVIGAVVVVVLLLLVPLLLKSRGGTSSRKAKGRGPSSSRSPRTAGPIRGVAIDGLRENGDVDNDLLKDIKLRPSAEGVGPLPPVQNPDLSANPVKPETDPALLEQTVQACLEKFQEMYIEMYIGLGLMSDFDQMRTEVSRRLANGQETYHAIAEMKMTPEAVVLLQMSSVAGNILLSGEQHIGRGLLGIHGQELLSVYRYAMTALQEKGLASVSETQSKLDFMEKKIRELG